MIAGNLVEIRHPKTFSVLFKAGDTKQKMSSGGTKQKMSSEFLISVRLDRRCHMVF